MTDAETTANAKGAADIAADVDTGGRNPAGVTGRAVGFICFMWAAFQLYIASNVPYWLSETTGLNVVINNAEARAIHLGFALLLTALVFPLFPSSPKHRVPIYDYLIGGLGVMATCFYLLVFKEDIAARAGLPTTADLVISTIGMAVLMISVYRALGLPLVIVATVFMLYVFFGSSSYLPEAIQWKGASYGKAMWHYWMQLEGVFGVALGVSASLIFLFVLFGALLEKAGAGNYFIKLAFALLGHLRGGPAKAAVVASAMSGLYSGSSIANTVTTGTFTIPLMKRTGFSPEKAGAVEVASSTNGQLTPPVMGAAAFLIAEFTGVSYYDILKHAFLPAIISYIALVYIVHLEALKLDLKGLPQHAAKRTVAQRLLLYATFIVGFIVLSFAVYHILGLVKTLFPEMTFWAAVALFGGAYLFLLALASRHADLEMDDPEAPIEELPRANEVAITGYYYLLPIVVLIWCILVERLSPGLSAFWATIAMIFIVFTQNPLKALFRGEGQVGEKLRAGWDDFVAGMISGARNMVGIAVATGAAGIIVGTISLTGAHQVVGEFVEFLSGGSLILMLVLVAIMSLILGMGLPTTANYIVVSSLMAPVIVALGAKTGLLVPLIAVHLFVFYFGILADDTPPVGLAAFAAAAISRGDPIKTGFQGFAYDIRTAILPFLFIFNTELLLIDVTLVQAIFIFIVAVIAMLLFAAATQGYFFAKSHLWESLALVLIAFTLFRPGYWLDQVHPPHDVFSGPQILDVAGGAAPGDRILVEVTGTDFDNPDETVTTTLDLRAGEGEDAAAMLKDKGLVVQIDGDKALIEEPFPGTPFFETMKDFDFYGDVPVTVSAVKTEADRLPKQLFYIPALLLLGLVIFLQKRRQTKPAF